MDDQDRRRRELARIHLGAKALGLVDEAYRTWLRTQLGVSSAAELDAAGRGRAIQLLAAGRQAPPPTGGPADGQARKIYALWWELARQGKLRNPSRIALRAFVKRQTGAEAPEFLSAGAANTVIEALKRWLEREEEAPHE